MPKEPPVRELTQDAQHAHWQLLLSRASAEDRAALWELLVELRPRLEKQIRHHINSAPGCAPSDVLHSVLVRVVERGAAFPASISEFLAWIGAIAHNRSMDVHRSNEGAPGPLPGGDAVPAREGGEERATRAATVWAAMQLLPKHYRNVLEATYHHRKTAEDIGRELGLKANAVYQMRYRALKHLHQLLEATNV
jgi:RNA polymerase sigma factor (sigma-70 family)